MDVSSISDDICYICFEALESHINKTSSQPIFDHFKSKLNNLKFPLFVTWHKRGQLRGCIGCFSPLALPNGIKQYAIIAATEDRRFSPISKNELQDLDVGISLLANFENAKDCFDWEIGKHGIRLYIDGRSSTFLPEVASEQNWDKITTLKNLARKGGFNANFDEDAQKRAKVERYESFKYKKTWDDYVKDKAKFS